MPSEPLLANPYFCHQQSPLATKGPGVGVIGRFMMNRFYDEPSLWRHSQVTEVVKRSLNRSREQRALNNSPKIKDFVN